MISQNVKTVNFGASVNRLLTVSPADKLTFCRLANRATSCTDNLAK